MAARKNGKRPNYRINVGDRVFWSTVGGSGFKGEVVEDRGHLGVGGRRLLRIRTFSEYEEARLDMEIPEEELKLMDD